MNKETAIQNEIMAAMSMHGALVWRQHVGKFRQLHSDGVISIGQPGMADLMAIVPTVVTADMVGQTIGLAVGVEVKTLTGKQRDAQKRWELAMRKRGAVYRVCRSVADAVGIFRNCAE